MSSENQTNIRFTLKETVWFQRGQEVKELKSLSLNPDINIQQFDDFVQVKGVLTLIGEYLPESATKEEYYSLRELSPTRLIEDVRLLDNGNYELQHNFPVDISIPLTRISDLQNLAVTVETFDYQIAENSCIQITADLCISGLHNDRTVEQQMEENSNHQQYEEQHDPYQVGDQEQFQFFSNENKLRDDQEENLYGSDWLQPIDEEIPQSYSPPPSPSEGFQPLNFEENRDELKEESTQFLNHYEEQNNNSNQNDQQQYFTNNEQQNYYFNNVPQNDYIENNPINYTNNNEHQIFYPRSEEQIYYAGNEQQNYYENHAELQNYYANNEQQTHYPSGEQQNYYENQGGPQNFYANNEEQAYYTRNEQQNYYENQGEPQNYYANNEEQTYYARNEQQNYYENQGEPQNYYANNEEQTYYARNEQQNYYENQGEPQKYYANNEDQAYYARNEEQNDYENQGEPENLYANNEEHYVRNEEQDFDANHTEPQNYYANNEEQEYFARNEEQNEDENTELQNSYLHHEEQIQFERNEEDVYRKEFEDQVYNLSHLEEDEDQQVPDGIICSVESNDGAELREEEQNESSVVIDEEDNQYNSYAEQYRFVEPSPLPDLNETFLPEMNAFEQSTNARPTFDKQPYEDQPIYQTYQQKEKFLEEHNFVEKYMNETSNGRQTASSYYQSNIENNYQNSNDEQDEENNYSRNDNLLASLFTREGREEKTAKLKLYFAQSGDTVDSVAQKYNISTQQLFRANNLEDQYLTEGQLLNIPISAVKEQLN
ncbi:LysM peptidoglycan-binding domain-containing protein [Bacillus sp. RG28]|uniref:LysM peptidoglycan-binding domain-containing protein n=1 Tax=Gottfriedia endophytica TaxID=2820819 RepID=A0A940NKK7_9BACI|nr:LysM peptidoglycan-binding domain-containing protein [Gottfriedia endophytica]MBP0723899.1 LysM peptidoglycan-binding domain-containing protein [Gottfriedia endophytica]